MTEWTDTPGFDVTVVTTVTKPEKSLVQHYRRQFTAAGVTLMAVALILTDRQLYGTYVGLLLYWLGALAISVAALGRFWCYVYNSGKRDKVVITEGPYSVCRNPIYLFSILASVGLGLIAQSCVLPMLFGALAIVFYLHIISGEEAKMAYLHGERYTSYLGRTQRLLPTFAKFKPGVVEHLAGAGLARKLPKLAALGFTFPLVELIQRAGFGVFSLV